VESTTAALRGTRDARKGFEREAVPYLNAVYSFALRLTRHGEDAHDLTQDAFVRAFERFGSFTRGTNCKAWLFSITYSIFVNQYHRGRRDPILTRSDERHELMPTLARPLSSSAQVVAEADVEAALARLPDDFRSAVLLVDVEELSYEEAAEILTCPVGTVRSRLYRGRKLLAEQLREYRSAGRERP